MPKLRTKAQNSMMHAIKAKLGLTHDDLREMAFDVSGGRTDHTSELYYSEAVKLIDRLQSYANPNTDKTPRRTTNWRKQKAGIETIVTAEHLQKMNALWFAKDGRTASGLVTVWRLSARSCRTLPQVCRNSTKPGFSIVNRCFAALPHLPQGF